MTTNLPPPVDHVFVDFENVQEIDLAIIGSESVSFTLLLGTRQTRLDVSLVEKLLQHSGAVQLIRLTSTGRNALDFTLVYYLGRAVVADPLGNFHIVSKDKDYDPLIEHLRSKNIRARRHDDFTTLTFSTSVKPPVSPTPVSAQKSKAQSKATNQPPVVDDREARVLEHLRKSATKRPRTKDRLVSNLVTHLGHKITETEALNLVNDLSQAGHLFIDEDGNVTYHLEPL